MTGLIELGLRRDSRGLEDPARLRWEHRLEILLETIFSEIEGGCEDE